jgi:cytosine/adenosine deaminase-related metal-dependent hydrolase
MWEEIQYAWNVSGQHLDGLFSSRQLVEMASSVPARVARIDDKVGTLAPGMYADFFLVTTQPDGPASDFYDAILVKPIADIDLVVIDGIPVYGDPAMLKSLSIATEPSSSAARKKPSTPPRSPTAHSPRSKPACAPK